MAFEPEKYGLPDFSVICTLGAINLSWAAFETLVTAAIGSLLKIDAVELAILLGRVDLNQRLFKLHEITKHKKQKARSRYLGRVRKKVDAMRPDRNILVHGRYAGKTADGGFVFVSMSTPTIEDGEAAFTARSFTRSELINQMKTVAEIGADFLKHFHQRGLLKLLAVPHRMPITPEATPPRRRPKKHPRPPRSSRT